MDNQQKKNVTTMKTVQSEADAEIERQRKLLGEQYAAAIKKAQADNDMLRAQQLYEAATIDGAGKFKQVLHVTLPGIASTIIVLLILEIGKILSLGYEKIILLYSPATYETADVISSFVYRRGLGENMQYSFSTAVGVCMSVVNLILVLSANKLSKKFTDMGMF